MKTKIIYWKYEICRNTIIWHDTGDIFDTELLIEIENDLSFNGRFSFVFFFHKHKSKLIKTS